MLEFLSDFVLLYSQSSRLQEGCNKSILLVCLLFNKITINQDLVFKVLQNAPFCTFYQQMFRAQINGMDNVS